MELYGTEIWIIRIGGKIIWKDLICGSEEECNIIWTHIVRNERELVEQKKKMSLMIKPTGWDTC